MTGQTAAGNLVITGCQSIKGERVTDSDSSQGISTESFVLQVIQDSVGSRLREVEQAFTHTGTKIISALELTIFAAFMPLLAMSMVRLSNDIQRDYTLQVSMLLNEEFGKGSGEHFRNRLLEYLASFYKDVAANATTTVPATIEKALQNINGHPESVETICQLKLVKILLQSLQHDMDAFNKITFN